MVKKKICLVTNWYPTEHNVYQGLFFREQAIALSDYYDFVVLHYHYSYSRCKEVSELNMDKQEHNITEYTINICLSTIHKWIKKFALNNVDYIEYLHEKVYKQLAKEKIDVFYSISGQTEAALTAKCAKYFNKPYIVGEHGPFPWIGTLVTEENKTAIENANAFLAISNDKIRQILMQGIKLPQIFYVGNMVDDDKFALTQSKNKVKTFISVGANVFYKNYAMLIETFEMLVEITNEPFKLLVVGYQANKGYSKDSAELENRFRESNFAKNVELIPSVPHDQMPELFSRADAFVMTSIQEGQPVSAIEAGCCGLPIFSTRCGGVEDYVDDSVGRIVNILDSEQLANYLKEYLEGNIVFEPSEIRATVQNVFGKKVFVQNMVKILRQYSG